MEQLLQKGAIISLGENDMIWADIPADYVVGNMHAGEMKLSCIVKIGDHIPKKISSKEQLTQDLHSIVRYYHNQKDADVDEKIMHFVESLNVKPDDVLDTSIFIGEYRVYKAYMESAEMFGTEGWHVFCEKVDDPNVKVNFFQSGDFAAKNEVVKIIRYE